MTIVQVALIDGIGITIAVLTLTIFTRRARPRLGIVICVCLIVLYVGALSALGVVHFQPRGHGW